MCYRHDDTWDNKHTHEPKESTDNPNWKTQTNITLKKVLSISLLVFSVEEYRSDDHNQNEYECIDKIGGYILSISRYCWYEEGST